MIGNRRARATPSSPKSSLRGKRLDFSTTTPEQPRCFSFDNRLKSPCMVKKEPDSPSLRCRQDNLAMEPRCFSFDSRLKEPGSATKKLNQEGSTVNSQCFSFDNRPMQPGSAARKLIQETSTIDSRCFSFDNRLKDQSLYEEEDNDSRVRRCHTYTVDQTLQGLQNTWEQQIHDTKQVIRGNDKVCISYICGAQASGKTPLLMISSSSAGPYSSMIEVSHIHKNNRRGRDLDLMNRNFSLMIKQLESVDPRNLTHQEKLAFWINIHNALVMHTFLANGILQNNRKRFLLLSKPAYNIGGRMVSIEAIQSYILRIRMPRPGQWLKLLLIPRKFRTGDEHQEYSLDHSEPLVYFALCSGSHSDPAIRVYTPKGIYQELETAKQEYVRATFGVKKDQKLVLPKIIESFSKDSGLSQAALMEMIQECLPQAMKKRVKKLN
ncbi:hypothetical protein F2Q69_00016535 [Brassica cretica]|uniref:DUF547 domain-containing protein n=1 Tax=Brassica cretica TaxID=69181 RepID=A0A8S9QVH2_BRACR|nr:hypothetical protein F2Q69_00016535 [Brassica cretica]